MSDSDKTAIISQFASVTGADLERSRFYLESAAWNLDFALESFYDQGDDVDPVEEPSKQDSSGAAGRSAAAGSSPEKASHGATSKKPPSKPQSRFATLSNVKDNDDNSDSEGEAYYAGGSEHGSGLEILDPRKKQKKNSDKLVKEMFKAAKEHGAEEVGSDAPSGSRPKPLGFRGTAYRLGETQEPSLSVPGFPAEGKPKQIDMVLKLWKQGFSVDGGPLRGYSEPENQDFLNTIKKGEVPKELIDHGKGGEVNLNMEDHRDEEYVAPKVLVKAFSGSGQRLGSPDAVLPAAPPAGPVQTQPGTAPVANPVDETKPATNLQIRLSDGSRLIVKFNHTHTVADVRSYINLVRPQFAGVSYVLMTTFPNKQLTDETQTLQDANLLNAVLVQKNK